MSDLYPWVYDWRGTATRLLPSSVAAGGAEDYWGELVDPLGWLDERIGELVEAMARPEEGVGAALDYVGAVYDVPRDDLDDTEYRSILTASILSGMISGTEPQVVAVWRALCTPGTDYQVGRSESVPGLTLSARIDWIPSGAWVTRAGALVAGLIPAGYDVSALVALPGGSLYGDPYGGGYSLALPT